MEVKISIVLNEEGLFATKQYMKGDVIFTLTGNELTHPTRETIHVGDNKHVHDKYGMFMNHSFTPSTYINKYNVMALIDIKVGDELTFDYNKNEINMAAPFVANGVMVSGKIII